MTLPSGDSVQKETAMLPLFSNTRFFTLVSSIVLVICGRLGFSGAFTLPADINAASIALLFPAVTALAALLIGLSKLERAFRSVAVLLNRIERDRLSKFLWNRWNRFMAGGFTTIGFQMQGILLLWVTTGAANGLVHGLLIGFIAVDLFYVAFVAANLLMIRNWTAELQAMRA